MTARPFQHLHTHSRKSGKTQSLTNKNRALIQSFSRLLLAGWQTALCVMVMWFWFKVCNELCFSVRSISNQTLGTIIHSQIHYIHSNACAQSLWKPFRLVWMLSKLFEGFVSLWEYNRQGAVCYCVYIVAQCGGVILQVAGRLTPLHRQTVKRKSSGWKDGRPSLMTKPRRTQGTKNPGSDRTLKLPSDKMSLLFGSVLLNIFTAAREGLRWGQVENNPN